MGLIRYIIFLLLLIVCLFSSFLSTRPVGVLYIYVDLWYVLHFQVYIIGGDGTLNGAALIFEVPFMIRMWKHHDIYRFFKVIFQCNHGSSDSQLNFTWMSNFLLACDSKLKENFLFRFFFPSIKFSLLNLKTTSLFLKQIPIFLSTNKLELIS